MWLAAAAVVDRRVAGGKEKSDVRKAEGRARVKVKWRVETTRVMWDTAIKCEERLGGR